MANNPYVNKVQLANGTTLIDLSTDTAIASDVAQGKYFHLPTGERVQGTATGGSEIVIEDEPNATGTTAVVTADDVTTLIAKSITQNGTYNASSDNADGYSSVTVNVSGGSSATQHSIYFEFSDSTSTTIPVYYDDALIGTMITAYTPTTYGQKTVALAQLDGVTWYDAAVIPIGVQLIDFSAVTNDHGVFSDGSIREAQGVGVSDYTRIDPTMTFSFTGNEWYGIAFYDDSKAVIRAYIINNITGGGWDGVLDSTNIPSGSAWVRISTINNPTDDYLSLIRTA